MPRKPWRDLRLAIGSSRQRTALGLRIQRAPVSECPACAGLGSNGGQAPALFFMCSITMLCSCWGLNMMSSASASTFTLCPGGQ